MINVTVFKIEKCIKQCIKSFSFMFIYYAISHLKPYINQIGVLQNEIETLKKHVSIKTQHASNFEFKRCFVNNRSSSKKKLIQITL